MYPPLGVAGQGGAGLDVAGRGGAGQGRAGQGRAGRGGAVSTREAFVLYCHFTPGDRCT